MTALPLPSPMWPSTAEQYAALPEDPDRRDELQERSTPRAGHGEFVTDVRFAARLDLRELR